MAEVAIPKNFADILRLIVELAPAANHVDSVRRSSVMRCQFTREVRLDNDKSAIFDALWAAWGAPTCEYDSRLL